MFPDFTRLKLKEKLEGQALIAQVVSSGTGAQGRKLEVKQDAWEECVGCLDYRTCYDLSLAKLLMNDILMNTMVANPWVGVGD
jgi:glycyl-tRNA synthetase (class II)